MFEEEAARVAVRLAAVRVAALVQHVLEGLAAQRHTSTHDDAAQLAELHVRQAVPAEGEGSAVAHGDVARGLAGDGGDDGGRQLGEEARPRGRVADGREVGGLRRQGQAADHVRQLEVLRLLLQALPLVKVLRQDELEVAEVVEDVAEEHPVPVDEDLALGVSDQARLGRVLEERGEERVRLFDEGVQTRGVHHSTHVQLYRVAAVVDGVGAGRHGERESGCLNGEREHVDGRERERERELGGR